MTSSPSALYPGDPRITPATMAADLVTAPAPEGLSPGPVALLDLDGTLMDSVEGIVASVRAAYAALGLPVPDDAALRGFVGPPITTSMPAHGVPAELLEAAVTHYQEEFARTGLWRTQVYDGVVEALMRLRMEGVVLVVATSKPQVLARPVCREFGLDRLVDAVFGAPLDESGSKASVIAEALAWLGPERTADPRDVVMVGDREHDVAGAAAHGIATLGVLYGYGSADELLDAGAVGLVRGPRDLAGAVLRQFGLGDEL
ncbi:HAD hydrolase-like protein [Cellulomonas marina]|uniref:Phosphoglycolate phosphatase n=1 Tax=Cellulomonas marina TaxID=988821 RepID=A0A1I0VCJ8_9CELL|nr:HAD hydrolase-like protein [Cellulomonas marina]GIG28040.1 5'-nucleotidase [Cellulomonas marina]SFA74139.1 phosphoglycolate phosphatase [Cellulomonas marina]